MKDKNNSGKRFTFYNSNEFNPNSVQNILLRVFASWLFSAGLMTFTAGKADLLNAGYAAHVNILIMVLLMGAVFFFATSFVLFSKSKYFDSGFLLCSLLIYTVIVVADRDNSALLAGVLVFWAFVLYYIVKYRVKMFENIKIKDIPIKLYTSLTALLFVAFVGGYGVFRYITYSTPNFDFGIFSQMFYYMKETFLPLTTLERGTLLSHFAIHISPIYYLLLPGYLIFPCPEYLQIMQAVVIASGVIPFYLICRHYQLSNKIIICLVTAFFFFPALSSGCYYDLHENCFLVPLLMWFFYSAEKRKIPLFYLFGILTLFVKEDAFIYVIFACIYFIIGKKIYYHGTLMMILSAMYFGMALLLLYLQGYGAMVNRFDNFMAVKNGSLIDVLKTVFVNPALVISESFEIEKLLYAITMLGTLGFLPLFCKKPQQLVLLMPLILMNLMPDYTYQHSIYFQYNFGSSAFLLYLSVMNISSLKGNFKRFIALFVVAGTIAGFFCTSAGKASYFKKYFDEKETINTINMYLEDIPSDASVIADTFFIPKLSNRKEIYEKRYTDVRDVDYYIYDMRSRAEEKEKEIEELVSKGYIKAAEEKGIITILSAK